MTALPPLPPAATDAVVAAITDTATAPSSPTAPASISYGVVTSIQWGSPTTLTITLAGSSVPIAGVHFSVGYSPKPTDTVICIHIPNAAALTGSDLFVLTALNGGSGSAGGPVPIGTLIAVDYVLSDPAWLLCAGGTFSATTYPDLYAARGNNNTLPDMRGVTLMGAGVNGITLGTRDATGHIIAHAHSHSHQVSHNHTGTGISAGTGIGGGTQNAGAGGTGTTNASSDTNATSAGTGTANVPPNYGVNVYIRAL